MCTADLRTGWHSSFLIMRSNRDSQQKKCRHILNLKPVLAHCQTRVQSLWGKSSTEGEESQKKKNKVNYDPVLQRSFQENSMKIHDQTEKMCHVSAKAEKWRWIEPFRQASFTPLGQPVLTAVVAVTGQMIP